MGITNAMPSLPGNCNAADQKYAVDYPLEFCATQGLTNHPFLTTGVTSQTSAATQSSSSTTAPTGTAPNAAASGLTADVCGGLLALLALFGELRAICMTNRKGCCVYLRLSSTWIDNYAVAERTDVKRHLGAVRVIVVQHDPRVPPLEHAWSNELLNIPHLLAQPTSACCVRA
ncbi:hypothetical protein GGR57DRAFT_145531 [Xylariaceae sp. FL1272]|nr:hypothetical protein GGR57DRAFT_145531 [Xylariaceae sp. FL1272]